MNTVQFRIGLALGALLMALSFRTGVALAQTPTPVTPGYQICNTNDPGFTKCSFQPLDNSHPLYVTGNNNVPTYSAALVGQAYSAAGDIYCVIGSATKVVKIKGIRVSAIATTAVVGDVSIVLRSTLDTGGGLLPVAVVAMDQNNAVATATVNSFTSAPTPGTTIGTVRVRKTSAPTAANSGANSEGLFQFSVYWDQPIVLRGANQNACVNVTAFGAGANWDIDHEHTEE